MDIIREMLWKCDLYILLQNSTKSTCRHQKENCFLSITGSHFEHSIIYWSITRGENLILQLGVPVTVVNNSEN